VSEPLTVSVPQAAKSLEVSKDTLYQLIHAREFPHVLIGTRIRIPHPIPH